jgi:Protein of unknown function (DUF4239)
MLSAAQDVLFVVVSLAVVLSFLVFIHRFWPLERRRDHNDIIGWQVSMLGTTYAVMMGFMLYAVWTSFQTAELNADAEANCLVNIYRLAGGLPEPQSATVKSLARNYADIVIDAEWPAMSEGKVEFSGRGTVEDLWAAVLTVKPQTFQEQTSMTSTLTTLSEMTEHRRIRQLESQFRLPGILWMVLLIGGALTTLSSCLFGTENFKLHMLQVFSITLLLSLALLAIADIDRPFQGVVHVAPRGFERARSTFSDPSVR